LETNPMFFFDMNTNKGYIEKLKELPESALYILADAFIPTRFYDIQSKTYAAIMYSFISGAIIQPEHDPTANKPLWDRLVHANPTNLRVCTRTFSRMCDMIMGNFSRDYIFYDTMYDMLARPEAIYVMEILTYEYLKLARTYPKGYAPLNPGEYERTLDEDALAFGLNPDVYKYALSNVLVTGIFSLIPYLTYNGMAEKNPSLIGNPRLPLPWEDVSMSQLEYYDDNTILKTYVPGIHPSKDNNLFYKSRYEFLTTMLDVSDPEFYDWFLMLDGSSCDNDNVIDVRGGTKGENRKEQTSEQFRDDPYVKYANRTLIGSRQRCFQASELLNSFKETENGFEFLDPDWTATGENIDPLNGRPVERVFTDISIKRLRKFCKDRVDIGARVPLDGTAIFTQLLDKINIGLSSSTRIDKHLNQTLVLMSERPEWRNDLLIYFGWLFLFAMWVRFWKGPGEPYPAVWINYNLETCTALQRDENINLELNIYGILMDRLEREKPELADYLKKLPYLHYSWKLGTVSIPDERSARELLGTNLVSGVINAVQLSTFCMAQASDLLSGTAFAYLTMTMGVPPQRFSDFILYVMKLLVPYESYVIDSRSKNVEQWLKTGDKNTFDIAMGLEQHKSVLTVNDPGFVQPPLDFSNIQITGHLPFEIDE